MGALFLVLFMWFLISCAIVCSCIYEYMRSEAKLVDAPAWTLGALTLSLPGIILGPVLISLVLIISEV